MSEIDKAIEYFEYRINKAPHAELQLEEHGYYLSALAALRDQQTREKGCECCKDIPDYGDIDWEMMQDKMWGERSEKQLVICKDGRGIVLVSPCCKDGAEMYISICPNCGRKLTKEAE